MKAFFLSLNQKWSLFSSNGLICFFFGKPFKAELCLHRTCLRNPAARAHLSQRGCGRTQPCLSHGPPHLFHSTRKTASTCKRRRFSHLFQGNKNYFQGQQSGMICGYLEKNSVCHSSFQAAKKGLSKKISAL